MTEVLPHPAFRNHDGQSQADDVVDDGAGAGAGAGTGHSSMPGETAARTVVVDGKDLETLGANPENVAAAEMMMQGQPYRGQRQVLEALQTFAAMYDKGLQTDLMRSHQRCESFMSQICESYDNMLRFELLRMLQEHGRIETPVWSKGVEHVITLSDPSVSPPCMVEEDQVVRRVKPLECKIRNATYGVTISVNVRHAQYRLVLNEERAAESKAGWLAECERRRAEQEAADAKAAELAALAEAAGVVRKKRKGRKRNPLVVPSEAEWTPRLSDYDRVPLGDEVLYVQYPLITNFPIPVGSTFGSPVPWGPNSRGWFREPLGYFVKTGVVKHGPPQIKPGVNVGMVRVTRKPNKHIYEYEIRSIQDDEKSRSTSNLHIELHLDMSGGKRVATDLKVNIPFVNAPRPLFRLFRILGVATVDELVALMWPDAATRDAEGEAMVRQACDPLDELLDEEELLVDIGYCTKTKQPTRANLIRQALLQVRNEVLPRIGTEHDTLTKTMKAVDLAISLRRVIDTALGKRAVDERSFLGNKYVEMINTAVSVMLRQLLQKFLTSVRRTIQDMSKHQHVIDLEKLLQRANELPVEVAKAFAKGQTVVKKSSSSSSATIIQLQAINQLTMVSHLERFNTKLQRRRSKFMSLRSLNPSYWGALCMVETPEGENCGLISNAASLVRVRQPVNTISVAALLRDLVLNPAYLAPSDAAAALLPISDLPSVAAMYAKYPTAKAISVNSKTAGFTRDAAATARVLREAKRDGLLPTCASIAVLADYVQVTTGAGALIVPLLVIDRLCLVPPIVRRVRRMAGAELWRELLLAGVLEFVDTWELWQVYVADTAEAALKNAQDYAAGRTRFRYSHIAVVPWMILGTSASLIPFSHHNQSPRNVYQSAMGKQATGIPDRHVMANTTSSLNQSFTFVNPHMQLPLATTANGYVTGLYDAPPGANLLVAVMDLDKVQEDAIVAKKELFECQFAEMVVTRVVRWFENTRDGADEYIGHPFKPIELQGGRREYLPTHGTRVESAYAKIDASGLPCKGTIYRAGEVIVGKTIVQDRVNPETGETQPYRTDASLALECPPDEIGRVTKVMVTSKNGARTVKVELAFLRQTFPGDKFSTRHGQKGTIGIIVPKVDLPWIIEGPKQLLGLSPDFILPTFAFSRMTKGQTIEFVTSLIAAVTGVIVDATPFQEYNEQDFLRVLRDVTGYGSAKVTMADGRTGLPIQGTVATGMAWLQRLKQSPVDKVYAHDMPLLGKRGMPGHQVNAGRQKKGGLRYGEMEVAATVAHGARAVLEDRMRDSSDRKIMAVCPRCGGMAESHHDDMADHAAALAATQGGGAAATTSDDAAAPEGALEDEIGDLDMDEDDREEFQQYRDALQRKLRAFRQRRTGAADEAMVAVPEDGAVLPGEVENRVQAQALEELRARAEASGVTPSRHPPKVTGFMCRQCRERDTQMVVTCEPWMDTVELCSLMGMEIIHYVESQG